MDMDNETIAPNEFNDLIIGFLSGNATDQEIDALRSWIALSAENKEAFVKMKIAWMASAQSGNDPNINVSKALSSINRKIDLHENTHVTTNFSRFKQILRIAAIFLCFTMIGSLFTYFTMKNNKPEVRKGGLISVYAPKGSKAMTVLPDGTQVWLNAGSNLSYNMNTYGLSNRSVTLIGQGFFKVITNPKKPFVVSAKNLQIKALGTEFDVKAYPEENTVETTLIKGIVKIEGKDQKKQDFVITMNPKQKVTFYSGKALIETSSLADPSKLDEKKLSHIKLETPPPSTPAEPLIDNIEKTDLYTSWKDDRWVFEGEEIGNLAVLLERRFNVRILFSSEELKSYKFTGIFQQETLEQILKVLKLTAPLQYTVGKGTVELTMDPDLKIKYKKYMKL
jgi:transmembrane sensor